MLFLISSAYTGIVEIKRCKLMTKPRRYGGKSHPATPPQEQTRPISTETEKNTLLLMSHAKTSIEKKKRCKLMTKPRRYGGKSHPATPTQEQTRPISTETSNLYKKYAVPDICCVNGHCLSKQNIANWWPNRADMVGNLIPRPQLRSRRDQWRRKLAIFTKKKTVFDISCKDEP